MEATNRRRERERRLRRQAMLEAAQAVFAEKGFTDATLDEVARRAEFGKGTLYNYFPDGKDGILLAILDDLYDELHALIGAAFTEERTSGRPFRAVFHDFIRDCFEFFQARQEQFLILIKEAQRMIFGEDRRRAVYFQEQAERMVEALMPHLEAAMTRGEIRRLDPHTLAHTVFGAIRIFHMQVCLQQCTGHGAGAREVHEPAAASEFITTIMLDGLLVHTDAPPSSSNAQA